MVCPLCEAMGGRFNAQLECCQLRQLAIVPPHVRIAAYERVRLESGPAAVAELKRKLRAERDRQHAIAAAMLRRRELAAAEFGRAATATLLQTIREHHMDISPLERLALLEQEESKEHA